MEPMARSEIFMAAAAGEYDGDLPIPVTREDQYWQKVIRKIEDGNATPEEIDAAIEAYLNSHDADIVTEAELSDALAGKVDKETGKGLTDINYSADEQAKVTAAYEARHTHDNKAVLDGITEAKVRTWDAAQPNVNADWNAYSGDARILNKPDLSVYAREDDMTAALAGKSDAGHTHDDRYYTESEIDAKVQTLNTAIGGKAESGHTHDDRYYTETETDTLLSGKANTGHTHDEATQSLAGLMSAADKTKLDGIATGANAYTHPAYTARTGSPSANQTPAFGGTVTVSQVTSDASGHVTGITDRTITIPDAAATQNTAGLMSAADKAALNALQPVILWSGASVANTITLNESVAGYDMVEVVGALSDSGFWSMSGKGIVNNGEVLALGLCSVKGGWTGVGLDIDGCLINISGSTLTRGSALPSSVGGGDSREIHLNATPSGSTLALTMNTGSNGAYNITILRVIGYKAVSA